MNKIGPHAIETTAQGLEWARNANIVKQLDRTDLLREAPDHAIRVFRKYFEDQDLTRHGGDVALEVIAGLGGYRHWNLYCELFNEGAQRLGQGLERHVEFTREAVAVFHAHGIKVAGFSFSTGNPWDTDWLYLRDQGFGGVDAVSIHEYWGNLGFTENHALRHRRYHRFLGGEHPPFIITETGRDAIEGGSAGWKDTPGVTPEQYVGEIQQYDAPISQDGYVLGATVFTVGPTPGRPPVGWDPFGADELVPALIGTGPPPPPPPPGPEVTAPAWLVLGLAAIGAATVVMLVGMPTEEYEEGVYYEEWEVFEIEEGAPIPPGYMEVE